MESMALVRRRGRERKGLGDCDCDFRWSAMGSRRRRGRKREDDDGRSREKREAGSGEPTVAGDGDFLLVGCWTVIGEKEGEEAAMLLRRRQWRATVGAEGKGEGAATAVLGEEEEWGKMKV
ncbi:hypothetical protein HAX54_001955 [Datura stramonium]|uniref:Uncharacterized protein n=1 Tax=Datura stramonium TaxID=4076 RepID=A0ABS8WQY9_DATST|nr:hypothetical protein [Datura stramonium]